MGIFFFLFVSSNLPLLLTFLNTEQHHFYSRIWNNTSSKWVKKTSHKMTATGKGALKHRTNTGAIAEEEQNTEPVCRRRKANFLCWKSKGLNFSIAGAASFPRFRNRNYYIDFFPMPIPQHIQALLNIHGHNRAPRWTHIISQKMCWGREKRDRYTHTALNFLILSMCRNTTKQKS